MSKNKYAGNKRPLQVSNKKKGIVDYIKQSELNYSEKEELNKLIDKTDIQILESLSINDNDLLESAILKNRVDIVKN
jgi:hypothetical protein